MIYQRKTHLNFWEKVERIDVNSNANIITFIEDNRVKTIVLPPELKKSVTDKLCIPVLQAKNFARAKEQMPPVCYHRNQFNETKLEKTNRDNAIREALTHPGGNTAYSAKLREDNRTKLEEISRILPQFTNEKLLSFKSKIPTYHEELRTIVEQKQLKRDAITSLSLR